MTGSHWLLGMNGWGVIDRGSHSLLWHWWHTEPQTDYCHRAHACLLPRLSRVSLTTMDIHQCHLWCMDATSFPGLLCLQWSLAKTGGGQGLRTRQNTSPPWSHKICLALYLLKLCDIINSAMTTIPVTTDLSSREDSNTCIVIPLFTIWAQFRQSTQLWIKTSRMGQGCLYIDFVHSQMMIVMFSISIHLRELERKQCHSWSIIADPFTKGMCKCQCKKFTNGSIGLLLHIWVHKIHSMSWVIYISKLLQQTHSLMLEGTSLVLIVNLEVCSQWSINKPNVDQHSSISE